MNLSRTTSTSLSVLFLLLFLASLGARFWSSNESTHYIGPDHIAASTGRVYVHVNGELLTLTTAGEVQHRQRVSTLGLRDSPIDLRALDDGRLLVAGQQPAQLRLCDPENWQCLTVGLAISGKLRTQYKVLVDANRDLLVADFNGRAIWRQPLAGGEVVRVVDRGDLRGPNDIVLDGHGKLWVADSAGHRLVLFERGADGAWKSAATLDARHTLSRKQRDWPMMVVTSEEGNLWVVQPDNTGGGADLLVYHPTKGAQVRIELPEEAYPTDIVRHGNDMLVTDMERYRIYRIHKETHAISDFGDARFLAEMRRGAELKTRYLTYSEFAMAGIILFAALMLLFAFLATPKDKRWTAPVGIAQPLVASNAPAPALSHVHWLKRNPKTERLITIALYVSYLVPALMAIAFISFFYVFDPTVAEKPTAESLKAYENLKQGFLVMSVVFVGIPVIMTLMFRELKTRLGTDGRRLYIRHSDGRQSSFAPEQLVYSVRAIACRDQSFPVQNGKGQSLYADREIETFITPLLRQARKLGPFEMLRYLLVHRNSATVFTVVYAVLIMTLLATTGLWKKIFLAR
jgi:hypothetical protein